MAVQAVAKPPRSLSFGSFRWPVAFAAVAILIYVFYQWIYPGLDSGVQSGFDDWFPLISINEALVWVMLALGLNVVVGYAGLLDLGFVAFWAIGGYTAGWLMSTFGFDKSWLKVNILGYKPANPKIPNPGIHLSFWFVLIAAGILCAICGMLIGAPTLRLRSDYLALVTLGFGEIIPQVFPNGDDIFGQNITNGTKGITPIDPIKVGSKALGPFDLIWKYVIFALLTALVVFVSLRLRKGRLGRAWLAIREDELAASSMGVPLMRTKLSAYGVGAVAGGLGGAAFATHIGGVLPDRFNFSISITLLAMVVLGGMGNVWGVIIGAFGLAWFNSTGLPEFGTTFNNGFGTHINFPSYSYLIFGVVLVLMMLFRREGILPESRTRLVLREPGRTEMESLGSDMEDMAPELQGSLPLAGDAAADAVVPAVASKETEA
jgi:branched-chain amino acid transport system permease protein